MNDEMKTVAALFVRRDSVYKLMAGVDAWDDERDALRYDGSDPIVAHPPCRLFGRLHKFAKADDAERDLAYFSVELARRNGGVVEHPAHSRLWHDMGLPSPQGGADRWGGHAVELVQFAFGHKALKPTWLYVVRCEALPTMPVKYGSPAYCIASSRRDKGRLKHVTHAEREHTPAAFAAWLVETARRCRSWNTKRLANCERGSRSRSHLAHRAT